VFINGAEFPLSDRIRATQSQFWLGFDFAIWSWNPV